MLDTVIEEVNLLGEYQSEQSVFTDRKVRLIGDGDVDLTRVDGDENESPLIKIENVDDNIDYQEDIQPKQEDQTIQQPVKSNWNH